MGNRTNFEFSTIERRTNAILPTLRSEVKKSVTLMILITNKLPTKLILHINEFLLEKIFTYNLNY